MKRRETIQRDLVLKAVRELKSHATAEEIYSLIVKDYPSIGKGTVYRNLNVLAEEGEIRKVEIPGEPERYDHILSRHYHVKCVKCLRVFDVDMDLVEGLESRIRDTHGMDFLDYDIIFRGLCPECKKKGEAE